MTMTPEDLALYAAGVVDQVVIVFPNGHRFYIGLDPPRTPAEVREDIAKVRKAFGERGAFDVRPLRATTGEDPRDAAWKEACARIRLRIPYPDDEETDLPAPSLDGTG